MRPAANTPIELPLRQAIAADYLAEEAALVRALLPAARLEPEMRARVEKNARRLVEAARAGRRKFGGVDAMMSEYGLSSEEGVVLMCLAEALLRVPDANTADKLIADKIGGRAWEAHLGHSDSLLVNASTWGLMLTGRVVDLGEGEGSDVASLVKRLVAKSGEPIIRQAMRHAMRIIGGQFVLGRTIEEALRLGEPQARQGYRFSFDMLGEAAMTARDAARYLDAYLHAAEIIAKHAGLGEGESIFARPGVSIKLSALHPRFEPRQRARIMAELVPRLSGLVAAARERGLALTIDAEEMDRLDLTLGVFAALIGDRAAAGWDGLGIAVQAYARRAMAVLAWLKALAEQTGHRIPVRLVKGAYWDSEIKRAQEAGLESYPVFTRKASTDVSFLACARFLLAHRDCFYAQFATHNAHSIAAVHALAGGSADYEFQRLHGMGQAIYEDATRPDGLGVACRIYAPVGSHEDLLAYLVRRLLENGANTSFVNRLADDAAPIEEIILDPAEKVAARKIIPHPRIPQPGDVFLPERKNSRGFLLHEDAVRGPLIAAMQSALQEKADAGPIVAGKAGSGAERTIFSPHDRRVRVGTVVEAGEAAVEAALASASAAQPAWDRRGGAERAELLEQAADLYEANGARLMALMVREAGKTLDNALADLREAADFLRYYAIQARRQFAGPRTLPSPTGERNEMHLHGRGVFACISPWNFPLAIFTGQAAAALAAGNTVLAKPAEQTPLVAAAAVRLMHRAGIPDDVIQLLPGAGEVVGARLVADRRVSGIAFTGSNETADAIQKLLAGRGGAIVPLIAETGGINAMIVDSTALPEQAVRDAVRSAFDSAGQRCSALRLLCVQEDIAGRLLEMLVGAMQELTIGDPLDYATDVGPVIDEDARATLEAHKAQMRKQAKTLVELRLPAAARHGTFVAPAAYEIDSILVLKREVFGPILHVVRFQAGRLAQVCEAINATGYGLTLGVHSRIDETVSEVASRVRVGNIYVNRNQIGAVVGAQPFGGEGLSGTGPKAGGPHYLPRFAVERVTSTDITASGGNAALLSLDPEGR
ncbi:MAG: bifunctional proline dehydrogenase/L-glutamate gamma-semialdehyde dehydrogenase PutA [Hyphomicrobiales bacterium]|nr:bifunctional proline dehydrogenase/L-glutamate gamma-semialdehyde dehydrogenase PutA [Hyphomicrobiales bacterium]